MAKNRTNLFKKYFLNDKPATGPESETEFNIYSEAIDMDAYVSTLQSSSLNSKLISTVRYKGKDYKILQLDREDDKAKKKLLIFAGVHGNEFAAALAVTDLLRDIKKNPITYNEWQIRIVAPLNPVGLAHNSRYNEEGYDINRDFKNLNTVGSRLQKDAIERFRPNFIVSLHEGPQNGFFIISEGKLPPKLRGSIIKDLQKEDIKLASKNFIGIKLHLGVWEKTSIAFFFQRLLNIYTLGRFAHERNIPAITTESSWTNKNVSARKRPHLIVIKSVVGNY